MEVARPAYEFSPGEPERLLGRDWSLPEQPTAALDFAWALALEAEVELELLDPGADRLHLVARAYPASSGTPQTVDVTLDGVALGRLTLSSDFEAYSLTVPPEAWRSGRRVLGFRFAYIESPQQRDPSSPDARTLAAAFDYVALTRSRSGEPRLPGGPVRRPPSPAAGVQVPPASQLAFALEVPRNGQLRFGWDGTAAAAAHVELTLRPDGEPEATVFRPDEASGPGRWVADLSAWAGRQVDLVFRSGATDGPVVRWPSPTLHGDIGAMDITTPVILIVIDTLRADVLGHEGGAAVTPNLDALAASGVRFTRAYSHIPITVPSHASLFTSLLPTEHGALNNGYVLAADHSTLAERLRASYRRTGAFVSLGVLQAEFGLDQGFDVYAGEFADDWWLPAGPIVDDVIRWLDRRPAAPVFLWTHVSDPHEPYAAPGGGYPQLVREDAASRGALVADGSTSTLTIALSGAETEVVLTTTDGELSWPIRLDGLEVSSGATITCRVACEDTGDPDARWLVTSLPATFIVTRGAGPAETLTLSARAREIVTVDETWRRYLAEVAHVDAELGRLLDRLADVEPTPLVVLTADHGENLGEHGGPGHVSRLYDTVLRVPLIVSWPGELPAGRVVEDLVAHVDVLPTLLDLLRIPDPHRRTGRSLSALLRGTGTLDEERPVLAETFRPESTQDRRALVTGRHKLIVTPALERVELYDLIRDPEERRDLSRQSTELVDTLQRQLTTRVDEARGRATPPEPLALGPDQLERLRALGYVR